MLRKGLLAGILVATGIAFGCGGQEEAPAPKTVVAPPAEAPAPGARGGGRGLGQLSVTLLPSFPTVKDDLQAVVSGGAGALSYRWERNGEMIAGQTAARLPAHSFVKGDAVTVVVGSGDGEARATTTVVNSPPQVISVPFADPYVHRGVDIVAKPEGVDVDGDPLDFRYLWSVNGEEVIGNDSPLLPGGSFRKGDRIALTVIPFDDEGEGRPFNGAEFTIPNAPPRFVSAPPLQFRARVYSYEAQAEDPDGDVLTYSLESAPPGMAIDGRTGHVEWEIGQEDAGEHRIRIVVQDEEGTRAFQEFTLTLAISE